MRKHDAYDDDDMVIPDGGKVTVKLSLMDSKRRQLAYDDARNHQPHFAAPANDAAQHDRAAARIEWIGNLQDAWKSPSAGGKKANRVDTVSSFRDSDRISARGEMILRMCDAWRTPHRDAAEPDAAEELLEPDDPDDDDRSEYQDYKDRLSRAWQTTIVGPGPAGVGPGPSFVGAGPKNSGDAQAIRDAALEERNNQLQNAWRSGK
jgi:hypothetical protein